MVHKYANTSGILALFIKTVIKTDSLSLIEHDSFEHRLPIYQLFRLSKSEGPWQRNVNTAQNSHPNTPVWPIPISHTQWQPYCYCYQLQIKCSTVRCSKQKRHKAYWCSGFFSAHNTRMKNALYLFIFLTEIAKSKRSLHFLFRNQQHRPE